MADEIEQKKREIQDLKESLKKKEDIFELIKNNNRAEAKNKLAEDNKLFSYFLQFKTPTGSGAIIQNGINGWEILYTNLYENMILEDLERLRTEIEEKENRLEQKIYLKEQQEYIKLQKTDITENKKNRKRVENFTFVLAFGVVISAFYGLFNILSEFSKAITLHHLILSAVFFVLFALLTYFVMKILDMKLETKLFLHNLTNILIIFSFLIVVIGLILILIFVPDVPIGKETTDIGEKQLENISKIVSEQNTILATYLNQTDVDNTTSLILKQNALLLKILENKTK